MKQRNRSFEPHLATQKFTLPPSGEWSTTSSSWRLCQITSGTGYWVNPVASHQLESGTLMLLSTKSKGSIRASQLGDGLSFVLFGVELSRLTALLTLSELDVFERLAAVEKSPHIILPPHSPAARKMIDLRQNPNQTDCWVRLQLLALFVEVFGSELQIRQVEPQGAVDARDRLRKFLSQTPASELLHIKFSELVSLTGCTQRHFSRVFREVVGMSFRDKHTELRLQRALELLAGTRIKVVDVAMESGFPSLSLFNLMFKRRFGITPGKWRENKCPDNQTHPARPRSVAGSLKLESTTPPGRRSRMPK